MSMMMGKMMVGLEGIISELFVTIFQILPGTETSYFGPMMIELYSCTEEIPQK